MLLPTVASRTPARPAVFLSHSCQATGLKPNFQVQTSSFSCQKLRGGSESIACGLPRHLHFCLENQTKTKATDGNILKRLVLRFGGFLKSSSLIIRSFRRSLGPVGNATVHIELRSCVAFPSSYASALVQLTQVISRNVSIQIEGLKGCSRGSWRVKQIKTSFLAVCGRCWWFYFRLLLLALAST